MKKIHLQLKQLRIKMNNLFVVAVFLFSLLQLSSVQGFSNFFSEIFEDMRIGKRFLFLNSFNKTT